MSADPHVVSFEQVRAAARHDARLREALDTLVCPECHAVGEVRWDGSAEMLHAAGCDVGEAALRYGDQDRRPASARAQGSDLDGLVAALRTIAPAIYVERLTGREASASGFVSCPLHDERSASLKVYETPERGWYCFGCGAGGDLFTLAGELWGLRDRRDFPTLVRRLAQTLGLAP